MQKKLEDLPGLSNVTGKYIRKCSDEPYPRSIAQNTNLKSASRRDPPVPISKPKSRYLTKPAVSGNIASISPNSPFQTSKGKTSTSTESQRLSLSSGAVTNPNSSSYNETSLQNTSVFSCNVPSPSWPSALSSASSSLRHQKSCIPVKPFEPASRLRKNNKEFVKSSSSGSVSTLHSKPTGIIIATPNSPTDGVQPFARSFDSFSAIADRNSNAASLRPNSNSSRSCSEATIPNRINSHDRGPFSQRYGNTSGNFNQPGCCIYDQSGPLEESHSAPRPSFLIYPPMLSGMSEKFKVYDDTGQLADFRVPSRCIPPSHMGNIRSPVGVSPAYHPAMQYPTSFQMDYPINSAYTLSPNRPENHMFMDCSRYPCNEYTTYGQTQPDRPEKAEGESGKFQSKPGSVNMPGLQCTQHALERYISDLLADEYRHLACNIHPTDRNDLTADLNQSHDRNSVEENHKLITQCTHEPSYTELLRFLEKRIENALLSTSNQNPQRAPRGSLNTIRTNPDRSASLTPISHPMSVTHSESGGLSPIHPITARMSASGVVEFGLPARSATSYLKSPDSSESGDLNESSDNSVLKQFSSDELHYLLKAVKDLLVLRSSSPSIAYEPERPKRFTKPDKPETPHLTSSKEDRLSQPKSDIESPYPTRSSTSSRSSSAVRSTRIGSNSCSSTATNPTPTSTAPDDCSNHSNPDLMHQRLPVGFQHFERYLDSKFGPDHPHKSSSSSSSSRVDNFNKTATNPISPNLCLTSVGDNKSSSDFNSSSATRSASSELDANGLHNTGGSYENQPLAPPPRASASSIRSHSPGVDSFMSRREAAQQLHNPNAATESLDPKSSSYQSFYDAQSNQPVPMIPSNYHLSDSQNSSAVASFQSNQRPTTLSSPPVAPPAHSIAYHYQQGIPNSTTTGPNLESNFHQPDTPSYFMPEAHNLESSSPATQAATYWPPHWYQWYFCSHLYPQRIPMLSHLSSHLHNFRPLSGYHHHHHHHHHHNYAANSIYGCRFHRPPGYEFPVANSPTGFTPSPSYTCCTDSQDNRPVEIGFVSSLTENNSFNSYDQMTEDNSAAAATGSNVPDSFRRMPSSNMNWAYSDQLVGNPCLYYRPPLVYSPPPPPHHPMLPYLNAVRYDPYLWSSSDAYGMAHQRPGFVHYLNRMPRSGSANAGFGYSTDRDGIGLVRGRSVGPDLERLRYTGPTDPTYNFYPNPTTIPSHPYLRHLDQSSETQLQNLPPSYLQPNSGGGGGAARSMTNSFSANDLATYHHQQQQQQQQQQQSSMRFGLPSSKSSFDLAPDLPIEPDLALLDQCNFYSKISSLIEMDSGTRVVLPEGWSERRSSLGRCYYTCDRTRRSSWNHPVIGPYVPLGWERVDSTQSGVYYQSLLIPHCQRHHPNLWLPAPLKDPEVERESFFTDLRKLQSSIRHNIQSVYPEIEAYKNAPSEEETPFLEHFGSMDIESLIDTTHLLDQVFYQELHALVVSFEQERLSIASYMFAARPPDHVFTQST